MRADAILAWQLLRGSPRSEWWRLALTALGAMLGTGFALAALIVLSIGTLYQAPSRPGSAITGWNYTNELLNEPGLRPGVIAALLLLILPVLAFLGQCTRIGALQRERRLAALRLAGATPRQVRRISALETGAVCGLGATAGLAGFLALRAVLATAQRDAHQLTWPTDVPVPWGPAVLVVLVLPVLATLEARFVLRRAGGDALGLVRHGRRPRAREGRRRLVLWLLAPLLLVTATGSLVAVFVLSGAASDYRYPVLVGVAVTALPLFALGLLYGTTGLALLTGRLAARSGRPALLIAGERLQADPWAGARANAAVLLTTLVGVGFVGVRRTMIDSFQPQQQGFGSDYGFYIGALNLTGLAVLIGLSVTISGLVVGTIESVTTRRRTLATLSATGVPRAVIGRAVLLETALPLVPAIAVAAGCGLLVTGSVTGPGESLPLVEPLLTAAGLLIAALLATATSLPLLRRTVRPAELRYE